MGFSPGDAKKGATLYKVRPRHCISPSDSNAFRLGANHAIPPPPMVKMDRDQGRPPNTIEQLLTERLYGLFGRKTGQVEGYSYSDANKKKGITW
jgi:cytochrome c